MLGGTDLKKGNFESKYIVSLTQLKKNISIIKKCLAQGLRKVEFRCCQQRREKSLPLAVYFLLQFGDLLWRLLPPSGSQGKNTEVVYHSLLQLTTFCHIFCKKDPYVIINKTGKQNIKTLIMVISGWLYQKNFSFLFFELTFTIDVLQ